MALDEEGDIDVTATASDVIDVELSERPGFTKAAHKVTNATPGGFFGIGIYNGKRKESQALLWRSAYQLGFVMLLLSMTNY